MRLRAADNHDGRRYQFFPQGRGAAMADQAQSQAGQKEERVPVMQQILDNPFLLLFLGITVPTVFYILWGVMEIATVPVTPLAK
jgi:hypothetical protein